MLNQSAAAKTDLDRAIQLATQNYEENPQSFHIALNLALYYLASSNTEQMECFYDAALRRGALPSKVQEAIQDLEIFLHLFPDQEGAKQAQEILEKA